MFIDSVIVNEKKTFIECIKLNKVVEVVKETIQFFNQFDNELNSTLVNLVIKNSMKLSIESYKPMESEKYLDLFTYSNDNILLNQVSVQETYLSQNELLNVNNKNTNNNEFASKSTYKDNSFISKDQNESQKSLIIFNKQIEKEFSKDSDTTIIDSIMILKDLRASKLRIMPEQVIFLNDWENFTTDIKHHILEKKLNKLKGEIGRKKSDLVSLLQTDSCDLPRRVLENAMERFIWKEEILKQLVLKKIITSEDFEWKKHPKYHIIEIFNNSDTNEKKSIYNSNSNDSRSFKLFFSINDLMMEYGFELLPVTQSGGLSSLGFLNVFRDKCFVSLSNCIKNNKQCLLVNDRFAENTVLAFGQFSGLPLTVSLPRKEGRSLGEYSDFLLKCVEFGGLHLFKGLERESNPEFITGIIKIFDLIEGAINRNQYSLELFDQSVSISKRFVFVGSFDGTHQSVRTPSEEYMSQLRNRFREVSISKLDLFTLLKFLLVKKGFQTAETIANKLFIIICELEEMVKVSKQAWGIDIKLLLQSLNNLKMSSGDHNIEQERIWEIVNEFWLRKIGLKKKEHKLFVKEVHQILSRQLKSQTKFKERIEFELGNNSLSDIESNQNYNKIIKDLTVAYGLDTPDQNKDKYYRKKSQGSSFNKGDRVYKTMKVNRINSESKMIRKIQSIDRHVGLGEIEEDNQLKDENNAKNREKIIDCFQASNNLLKLFGQEEDRRPIMVCGNVYSGKSQTLASFQKIIDNKRGGKTRVARIFPEVHQFDELFGKGEDNRLNKEYKLEEDITIQDMVNRKGPKVHQDLGHDDFSSEEEEQYAKNCK